MFKRIKQWYINYRHRRVTAQGEVYMIVYRSDANSSHFAIKSIHRSLDGAKKFYDKLCKEETLLKEYYHIERYGLWE